MKTLAEAENFVDIQLARPMQQLKQQQAMVRLASFGGKALGLLALIVFISLFLTFVTVIMPSDGFFSIFKLFFLLVLSFVMGTAINSQVVEPLWQRHPSFQGQPAGLRWLFLIVLTAVVIALGYLGSQVLAKLGGLEAGKDPFPGIFVVFGGAVGAVLVLALLANVGILIEKRYQRKAESQVFQPLLSFILSNAQFDAQDMISRPVFEASQLYVPKQKLHKYKGWGLFKWPGDGERSLSFSQLHVKEREVKQRKGKTEIKISTLFKGEFYHASLSKAITTTPLLVVEAAYADMLPASVGKWLERDAQALPQLKTNDAEFDTVFRVHGSQLGEVEAVLTPTIRRRLMLYREHMPFRYRLGMHGKAAYLALEAPHGLLRASLSGAVLSRETLQQFYLTVQLLMGLGVD